MSFSQEIKKEIVSRELPKGCCAKAAAYAVACFGKYFDAYGVVLHTELLPVAQYAKKVMERTGIEGKIIVKGSAEKPLYEYAVKDPAQVAKMLALFGHTEPQTSLQLQSSNFACERCVNSFVATAFVCSGTTGNPEKEYNLEFLSSRSNLLHDFEALLCSRDFTPRITVRKGSHVLYLKASEQIEDLLTFMGATNAALEIMNMKVYKDFRNKANRITNCETANIEKMVEANQTTLQAIAYLQQHGALETLSTPLQQAAQMRIAFPDLSLKALACEFHPPLSKSGLSHRMKKLEQVAQSMKERANNG